MPNKMLIDATHPEETRVVVLRGQRVEEFDFESASRKQLRGNIYLAKVTRVEPSLQAAFVDYGGNRHGFLAFSEIHPDYYQIPVADRQALIAEDARAQRAAEAEADHRVSRHARRRDFAADEIKSESIAAEVENEWHRKRSWRKVRLAICLRSRRPHRPNRRKTRRRAWAPGKFQSNSPNSRRAARPSQFRARAPMPRP